MCVKECVESLSCICVFFGFCVVDPLDSIELDSKLDWESRLCTSRFVLESKVALESSVWGFWEFGLWGFRVAALESNVWETRLSLDSKVDWEFREFRLCKSRVSLESKVVWEYCDSLIFGESSVCDFLLCDSLYDSKGNWEFVELESRFVWEFRVAWVRLLESLYDSKGIWDSKDFVCL